MMKMLIIEFVIFYHSFEGEKKYVQSHISNIVPPKNVEYDLQIKKILFLA